MLPLLMSDLYLKFNSWQFSHLSYGGCFCSAHYDTLGVLVLAGATLFSFALALCFFLAELLIFKTLSWKTVIQPLVIASEPSTSLAH